MLIGEKVVLRDKTIGDAANDYAWRCDPDLCRLDAVPTLDMPYIEYVSYYGDELRYPSKRRCRFAIDTLAEGRHVGNCMYYDIDRDSHQAELGIMIGDREYWGRGYGPDAVTTLVRHIFDDTSIDRIYLKTLEWNLRAQGCFRKGGFVTCGRTSRHGHDFLVMEMHRRWAEEPRDAARATQLAPDDGPSHPHST